MTNRELAAFIDWEGGTAEAVRHGMDDPLEDPVTQRLWNAVVDAQGLFEIAEEALQRHLDQHS